MYAFSCGEKKWRVSILDITLFRSKERWPPRVGSLNLFKNHKTFLTKEHYILHTALKGCQEHVDYHHSPPFKKVQCTQKQGVHNSYRETLQFTTNNEQK